MIWSMAIEEFPFDRPEGSEAECFIQWKNTRLCMDLYCSCGYHSHIDDEFVHGVRCPECRAVWQMGTQVILKRNDDFTGTIRDARE